VKSMNGHRLAHRRYVYTVGLRQTNVRETAIEWHRETGALIEVLDGWNGMSLVGRFQTAEGVP